MQGAGNDYIYIDIREVEGVDLGRLIPQMCDRHFGVGGDGVVLVDYDDKRMIMYNANGSRGAICGNALRCVGHLLYLVTGEGTNVINTDLGPRRVERVGNEYRVEIGKSEVVGRYEIDGQQVYMVNVGNLHAVAVDLDWTAKELAEKVYQAVPYLQEVGVNAEVVREEKVEVYERGTGYTLSCGSGSIAVATVLWELGEKSDEIQVAMKGGVLKVTREGDNKYLQGDAIVVFRGVYDAV